MMITSKDQLAELLKTNKASLEQFEKAYAAVLNGNAVPENPFEINAKQAAEMNEGIIPGECPQLDNLMNRIITELVEQTPVWDFDGKKVTVNHGNISTSQEYRVTSEEVMNVPEQFRPQLTGYLMKKDMSEPGYPVLLSQYLAYQNETDPSKKKIGYDIFRQGLDILDIDPVIYEMLGMNENNMGNWLPYIVEPVLEDDIFKIPKTTIIKVPMSMLQLTRLSYETLTRTTLDIVDRFCQKVFRLDENMDYFIKTGIYSSKFDFRNAYVHGSKEVRELGEYLLYIHSQTTMMACPMTQPSIYGVATTNEWVVREFIHDKENNPCIYKGLPLHTEYRVFVDFDTKEILGISPYWEPDTMKKRFGHASDSNSPHNMHDYVIYKMHEDTLMKRYDENKDHVLEGVQKLLNKADDMHGQWSIDIMQNADEFYVIDMALAANSALQECVPAGRLKKPVENWIPEIKKKE